MDDKVTKGIILLIIGLGITLYFQPLIADHETDLGQYKRNFDEEEQREYEVYIAIRTIGIILMVVGAIIISIRIVESQKKPYQQSHQQHPQQQYQQPTPQPIPRPTPQPTQQQIKICKNCYAKLDTNWISCPYCGQSTS